MLGGILNFTLLKQSATRRQSASSSSAARADDPISANTFLLRSCCAGSDWGRCLHKRLFMLCSALAGRWPAWLRRPPHGRVCFAIAFVERRSSGCHRHWNATIALECRYLRWGVRRRREKLRQWRCFHLRLEIFKSSVTFLGSFPFIACLCSDAWKFRNHLLLGV